ncbi:Nucleic acid dioxygenase alkbh1 [Schistosoma haematobium]|uniref:Nucleic acid dioxygenase alkbh1 n=1 Tax=Schistosoma haematobium TaxID=6185 RepID=A0A922IHL5_SCHHA|nr:Nucleic acid dioxygenase alkbh1 [Schistosoma haematobium]KAH9579448.1 Nucleic acid dioxygenase alkbh1 [Schistosoma haematobium]
MAYSDEDQSSYLKDVFKFYKHLNYTHDVREQIRRYTDSTFKYSLGFRIHVQIVQCRLYQPKVGLYHIHLCNQTDFFIIKNFFSPIEIKDLWLAALTEWCHSPTAQCNLSTNVSHNNRMLFIFKTYAIGIACTDPWYSKLRWVTLGYHYQWGERIYNESKVGEFPSLLYGTTVNIINFLKHLIEEGEISSSSSRLLEQCRNYTPEASIVNYYRTKTTMGFHSDDAEIDKEAPLVSISVGPTALFLLETSEAIKHEFDLSLHGSFNRAADYDHVLPIYLCHGDVVIMAGKSRLARHAVPVIFFDDDTEVVSKGALRVSHDICEKFLKQDHNDDACTHCQECLTYIRTTRINMNIRQVMPVHR